MNRFLFLWLVLLVPLGCQPQPATSLVTSQAQSGTVNADEPDELPEIPLQEAAADVLSGQVIRVADGDTLTLLVDDEDAPKQVRVRLEGIDCPESSQAFGQKAKQALSDLVLKRTVKVWSIGQDRYGRTLGRVYVGEDDERIDVNLALVAQGMAWHYKQYSDDENLAEAETAARSERRGLWTDSSPMAPWDWRDQQRKTESEQPEFTPAVDGKHWLNTSSGVRHNNRCEQFGKTKRGRPCEPDEGRPCGICGG